MGPILFTHSYFYRFDPKQWNTGKPYPPYGTICAAALMRKCGYDVSLFDPGLKSDIEELNLHLQQIRPKYLVIYDDGFNYLTKMCLTRMRDAAFDMVRIAKSAGCIVLLNSSDSSDHYAKYLDAGADVVILGEGEITLRDLVQTLDLTDQHDWKTKLSGIPGIAFYDAQGNIQATPRRPVLTDLDSLPEPAWDLVDIQSYQKIWNRKQGYFSLNLATTRGCPYKCNWCAKPIYGNRYHARSPERVVAEIEMLIQRYGVRHFWMADDIFGLKPAWVQQFRHLVLAKNLQFQYKIQSRADLLLKEDTIDALVASGLQQVWVGAESGSQAILDAMDKGTTIDEIKTATRLLQARGVEVCFFLQFGYPGETRQDISATIDLMRELKPHDIGISVSYPLPGTKFYENVRSQLGGKQNWEVSDDLALMHPSTYPPAYYRRLHRLVHKIFRLGQGKSAWQESLKGKRPNLRRLLMVPYYVPALALDRFRLWMLEKPLEHGKHF